ncbi:MAG: hypothetical protein AAB604_00115 [Patescibacteria group bacterium]
MIAKLKEKDEAIALRKRGFSYSEILQRIPVAKSSLSLWLHSVGLSKHQKQRLTEKKLASMKRGWLKVMEMRQKRIEEIQKKAKGNVSYLISEPLWMMGTALYWAEGTKMKSWRRGEAISFSNMDPFMLLIIKKWLKQYLKVKEQDMRFELYLHETSVHRLSEIKNYWVKFLKIPMENIPIYFKKNKFGTRRKNIGGTYFGLMRIKVRKSAALNHRVTAWIEGLSKKYCGVV